MIYYLWNVQIEQLTSCTSMAHQIDYRNNNSYIFMIYLMDSSVYGL